MTKTPKMRWLHSPVIRVYNDSGSGLYEHPEIVVGIGHAFFDGREQSVCGTTYLSWFSRPWGGRSPSEAPRRCIKCEAKLGVK
jgi:hypothetical protein